MYNQVTPHLRGPHVNETNGQALFLVPGVFWFEQGCTGNCSHRPSIPPFPDNVGNGHCCAKSPAWLVEKLVEYWNYAQRSPFIVGFNGERN